MRGGAILLAGKPGTLRVAKTSDGDIEGCRAENRTIDRTACPKQPQLVSIHCLINGGKS